MALHCGVVAGDELCGQHTLKLVLRIDANQSIDPGVALPPDFLGVDLILAATSSPVPSAPRVKTISSLTARIAPNQTLRLPVSWAPAHYRLCRCNHKAGAWKMHANLADLTITASDHDLVDV